MKLEGKVALVTGGTRGIGKAIYEALEADGCRVVRVSSKTYDLRDPENMRSVVPDVVEKYGRIDILVNNAGRQYIAPAGVYPFWEESIALMLTAPLILSQYAGTWMLRNGGGHIVNILSTSAFQATRNNIGYVAAKHGLLGITRALALEWAPDIHVNAVAPGLTETDMIADMTPERRAHLESITPSGRFSTPEEIAQAVLFLVTSTNIYGQTITVDGGWMVKNG